MEIANKNWQSDLMKAAITEKYIQMNQDVSVIASKIGIDTRGSSLAHFRKNLIELINLASFNERFAKAVDPVYIGFVNSTNPKYYGMIGAVRFWKDVSTLMRKLGLIVINDKE